MLIKVYNGRFEFGEVQGFNWYRVSSSTLVDMGILEVFLKGKTGIVKISAPKTVLGQFEKQYNDIEKMIFEREHP